MIVLGLHFGHDAACALIADGRVLAYALRERHARVKHALGLDASLVDLVLADAGIGAADVDYCAVSSTQGVELLSTAPALRVAYAEHRGHTAPCRLAEALAAAGESIDARLVSTVLDSLYAGANRGGWLPAVWAAAFPEHQGRPREDFPATGCIDRFVTEPAWEAGATFAELRRRTVGLDDTARLGFHHPAVVHLRERAIPAYVIHHHLAHAASSYYLSGFDEAAILTHDGYSDGTSYHGGMYYFGRGHRLYPLSPHHLSIGALYDRVGLALHLSTLDPAGKLMGLAAYGEPRFFEPRFVGNHYDHRARLPSDITSAWLYHCLARARREGDDMQAYADPKQATARVNADVAASTQRLFDESRFEAVAVLREMLVRSGLATANLCLSGGTALNCPSNSRLAAEGGFARVWVEPACDDGGLALGSALVLYHSIFDHPRPAGPAAPRVPYLGVRHDAEAVRRALARFDGAVTFRACEKPGREAARELAEDRVIGWYEGRSEAGPRALGHRSILADPRRAENWPRVNRIKDREPWRPLAPAVLAEEASHWFAGAPATSPYMLFNARVTGDRLPAVTHVDGTARIQTVDPGCGEFRRLLEAFFEQTGVPVVLNTSLNGRGEPLVETPDDALGLFVRSELDALYIDGYRVVRRGEDRHAAAG